MRNLNPQTVVKILPWYIAGVLPATCLSVWILGETWGAAFAGGMNLLLLLLLVRGSAAVQEGDH